MNGKLDGSSIRVPTPNVSCVDLKVVLEKSASIEEIDAAMRAAAAGPLKNVLGVEDAPLVSMDYNHNPFSSTYAAPQTKVMSDGFTRVLAWYDNEWGFSCRMADTALAMAKFL